MVWRWVQLFNEGHKNVRDGVWSCRLSVVNEDLVRAFEERIRENTIHHYIIFLKFHCHFFMKLCQIKLSFGNCVHTGCRRCLRKNTN